MAERYAKGATCAELAPIYEVSEETIRAVVARSGVARRAAHTRGYPVGTKRPDGRGYIKVKTVDGWRLDHALIMERSLGRPLREDEHVHHKNEVGTDNREENLELLTRKAHGRRHFGVAENTIQEIRKQYSNGVPVSEILSTSGVSVATLYKYTADLPRRRR